MSLRKIFPALKIFVVSGALFSLPACELSDQEVQSIQESFHYDSPVGVAPSVDVRPACFLERFVQPEAQITRKIDLLFVTDTSGSLDVERAGIADGIDGFIAALPAEVDYRIGVMMGHGSRSSWAGRLYKKDTDPIVLKSSELSLTQLRAHLMRKLTRTVGDWYSDGGEENFYSLWRGLEEDRVLESRAAGFFREDAALAVVFISDENEICSDFPAGVTPVRDAEGLEDDAKRRDCDGISPASLLARIRTFQGERPLVVGGIIYNRLETVPSGGENEFGYGYVDIISLANGVSVDLADAHYQDGLNQIGTLASIKMRLIHDFVLARTEIDRSTLTVDVDGLSAAFEFDAGINTLHLPEPGRALSVVDIQYCLMPEPTGGEDPGTGEGEDPGTGGGEGSCTGLDCGVFGV